MYVTYPTSYRWLRGIENHARFPRETYQCSDCCHGVFLCTQARFRVHLYLCEYRVTFVVEIRMGIWESSVTTNKQVSPLPSINSCGTFRSDSILTQSRLLGHAESLKGSLSCRLFPLGILHIHCTPYTQCFIVYIRMYYVLRETPNPRREKRKTTVTRVCES